MRAPLYADVNLTANNVNIICKDGMSAVLSSTTFYAQACQEFVNFYLKKCDLT